MIKRHYFYSARLTRKTGYSYISGTVTITTWLVDPDFVFDQIAKISEESMRSKGSTGNFELISLSRI